MSGISAHAQVDVLSLQQAMEDSDLSDCFACREAQELQWGLPWLSNLAAHGLDGPGEGRILVARPGSRGQPDGSSPIAAVPMRIDFKRRTGHALSSFYTTHYTPLLPDTQAEALLQSVFSYLATQLQLTTIDLAPLATADPTAASIITSAARAAGWRGIHPYPLQGSWAASLGSSGYAEYLGQRPARVRNTLRRKTARLIGPDKGQLEVVSGGNAVSTAVSDFNRLYDASWKPSEPNPAFIPALCALAAARGWLRLGLLRLDGKVIAAQLWLVQGTTASMFKITHDHAFDSHSPGTVLTALMLEHVIDTDGVSRIDLLSGDDNYKQDWVDEHCPRAGIAAFNPRTMKGAAMAIAHALRRRLRPR